MAVEFDQYDEIIQGIAFIYELDPKQVKDSADSMGMTPSVLNNLPSEKVNDSLAELAEERALEELAPEDAK